MEVSGQLHAPVALPLGKVLAIHSIGGCIGPIATLVAAARRKDSCLCREPNPGRPPLSLVTPINELSRIML